VLPTRAENFGQIMKILMTGAIRPLAAVAPELPADLCGLVDRMLEPDRAARLPDLGEARAVLARHGDVNVTSFGPAVAPAPSLPPAPLDPTTRSLGASREERTRRRPLRLAAALAAVVVLGGGAWLAVRPRARPEAAPLPGAPASASPGGCDGHADCVSGRCFDGECRPWSGFFGHDQRDAATAVAVAPNGDVLVAGYYYGSIELGCGPLVSAGSPQIADAVVARFSRSGICQWARRFGGTAKDFATTLLVTPAGHAVISGAFDGTVDFGAGPLVAERETGWILELDEAGAHVWSRPYDAVFFAAVARDRAGNLIAVGSFAAVSIELGGERLLNAAAPYADAFVVKTTPRGEVLWARAFPGPSTAGDDQAQWVAVDARGDVVVNGTFYERADFGGGMLTSAGGADAFLTKLSGADGVHLWSKRFGTAADEPYEGAVAFDAEGNVVNAGEHRGADRGGGALPGTIFLAKYGPEGEHLWSHGYGGGSPRDCARRVAIEPDGDVVFAGRYLSASLSFDAIEVTNVGGSDVYLARADAETGAVLGVRTFFATDAPVRAMALDPTSGNVVIGGRFEGTIDFSGSNKHVSISEDGYFASVGAPR
jgi:hypothetical protein